jgi:hypothetical protein
MLGLDRNPDFYGDKGFCRLPPEVELDLPIPFRDPQKAVMYTLFAYEFPFFMEKKIRGMEKQVHYDYEALAKEYFERNKKQNQFPGKKIDWSKVPVHDYLEMEE